MVVQNALALKRKPKPVMVAFLSYRHFWLMCVAVRMLRDERCTLLRDSGVSGVRAKDKFMLYLFILLLLLP